GDPRPRNRRSEKNFRPRLEMLEDRTLLAVLGTAKDVPLSGLPAAVARADVNGDNKQDLLVPLGSNEVAVLLGNGNGTFQAQQTLSDGSYPDSIATADFNGDTKPDLVTTSQSENVVSVFLGNGNGTFAARQTVTGGPVRATADFNGDGKL